MLIKTGLDLTSVAKVKSDTNKLIADLQNIANKNPIKIQIQNTTSQINQINNSMRNLGGTANNTSNSFKTLSSSMGGLVSFYARWISMQSAFNLVLSQSKKAIDFAFEQDERVRNISMITGEDRKTVQGYTKDWNDLGLELKQSSSIIAESNEEWSRAGANLSEINELTKMTVKTSEIAGSNIKDTTSQAIALKNAYGLTNAELKNVLDGVVKMDNTSATGTDRLLRSLLVTSSTAKQAKVPIDFLVAGLTTVQSKSKQTAESVGKNFRNIFLNMTKMTNGEDQIGLNKAEDQLNKLNIAMRSNKDTFRSADKILNDLAGKWSTLTEKQQAELGASLAQKENINTFNILMQNQAETLKNLNNIKSAGGSVDKAYEEHLISAKGALGELKATLERLYSLMISGDGLKNVLNDLTKVVQFIEFMITDGKELTKVWIAMLIAVKNFKLIEVGIMGCVTAFKYLRAFGLETLTLLNFNPIILSITALVAILATVTYSQYKHAKQVKELKADYEALNKAMSEMNGDEIKNQTEKLKEMQKELDKLKANAQEEIDLGYDINDDGARRKLAKYIKTLEESGYTVDKVKNKIVDLSVAEGNIATSDKIQAIQNKTNATIEEATETQSLINQYQNLSGQENLSAEKKQILSNIAQQLVGRVQGLTTSIDENGNMVITNTKYLGTQIDVLELLKQQSVSTGNTQIESAIMTAQAIHNGSIQSIDDMKAQILGQQTLANALASTRTGKMGGFDIEQTAISMGIKNLEASIARIESLKSKFTMKAPTISGGSSGGSGYKPSSSGTKNSGGSSSKSQTYEFNGKSDDQFQIALAKINSTLDKTESKISTINQEISNLESLDDPSNLNKILAKKNELLTIQQQKTKDITQAEKDNASLQATIQAKIKSNFNSLKNVDYTNFSKEEFEKYNPYANLNLSGLTEAKKKQLENGQALWESLINGWVSAQSQKLTIKDDLLKNQGDINNLLKDMNDTIKEKVDSLFETEKENKLLNYDKELEKFTKLQEDKISLIDKEIESLNKVNDEEQEKEERLKRQNDLLQMQNELANVQNEKNVRMLMKDENGNEVWKYVADQTKVNELNKQINDKKEDNAKWEKDLADKHYLEKLEAQKKSEQDLITDKEKYYEDLKTQEEKYYHDIDKLSNDYMINLKNTYGNNWDDILLVLDSKLTQAKKKNEELLGFGSPTNGKSITVNTEIDKAMLLNKHPELNIAVDPNNVGNQAGRDRNETLYLNEKALGINKTLKVNTEVDKAMLLAQFPWLDIVVEPNEANARGKDRYETFEMNKKLLGLATGGMTLDWNDGSNTNGKIVELHPNELVNNPLDTTKLLKASEFLSKVDLGQILQVSKIPSLANIIPITPRIDMPDFSNNWNNNSAPKSNITNYNIDIGEVLTNNVDDFVRQMKSYTAVRR